MKTLELTKATSPLADYTREVDKGSVIVTRNNEPVAALAAVQNADLETISLNVDPRRGESSRSGR
jgi:antitoxin (DNA-binding transcriptional repressor) of toxin-antitoxin stability system